MSDQPRMFQRTLDAAVDSAVAILSAAKDEHQPTATCLLYSGGKDSSVLIDVLQPHIDHVVHIDTGVGLAATRQYVEEECARRGLSLIVESGESYRDMVLKHGFPGPHAHLYAYSLLKERALRKVRRRFVTERGQRVIFVSGVRSDESGRRKVNVAPVPVERDGSIVWVNPLWDWQNDEMAAYRKTRNVSVSPVYEHIHMSGECLCGAFGSAAELDEIEFFFPDDPTVKMLRDLEREVEAAGVLPCQWGPGRVDPGKPVESGRLCSSCEFRLPGTDVA